MGHILESEISGLIHNHLTNLRVLYKQMC